MLFQFYRYTLKTLNILPEINGKAKIGGKKAAVELFLESPTWIQSILSHL